MPHSPDSSTPNFEEHAAFKAEVDNQAKKDSKLERTAEFGSLREQLFADAEMTMRNLLGIDAKGMIQRKTDLTNEDGIILNTKYDGLTRDLTEAYEEVRRHGISGQYDQEQLALAETKFNEVKASFEQFLEKELGFDNLDAKTKARDVQWDVVRRDKAA